MLRKRLIDMCIFKLDHQLRIIINDYNLDYYDLRNVK